MLHKRKYDIVVITLASLFYVLVCNWSMTELPHMTWFDFIPMIDKFYTNTLHISDLFSRYGEHGMLAYNILLLINTVFFNLTTFFDVYINDVNVILGGILFIFILNKLVDNAKLSYKIGVIIIALVQFTSIQKSSGAMETQVRLGILFFIISTILVDNIFIKSKNNLKSIIIACLLIICSINVFGTFYNFSGLPMICSIGLFIILKFKGKIKEILPILLTYVVATVCYIFEYGIFASSNAINTDSQLKNIIDILFTPVSNIKSVLGYNACGIFGSSIFLDGNISVNIYLWLGLIITLIICFSIYEYFKTKMYLKTYLPIFFIAYSLMVCIFIIIGRADNDWTWCLNEWYIVHAKIQFIGVIWILIYYIQNSKRQTNILAYSSCFIILIITLAGNYYEIKRLPSIKIYYQDKQKYLFAESINDLPTDANGNTPLLESAEKTIKSIEIMRKYSLNVYKYYHVYNDYIDVSSVKSKNSDGQILSNEGMYDDNWIGKQADLKFYSETGKINLKLYCPFDYNGTQKGILYVNGIEYKKYNFENDIVDIIVNVKADSIVNIRFENQYSVVNEKDIRELCFVLNIIK